MCGGGEGKEGGGEVGQSGHTKVDFHEDPVRRALGKTRHRGGMALVGGGVEAQEEKEIEVALGRHG